MNLYCIKCLIFAKSNNIKIKREIIGKIIFSFCVVMTAVLKSS